MTGDVILSTESLGIQFGGLQAVGNVNLNVRRGGVTSLIGPNGAGKTTVFNMVTGIYRPTAGRIRVHSQRGGPAIAINATRETGANVLEVMDGIRATVKDLNDGLLRR